jgi:general secretion pathway protein D
MDEQEVYEVFLSVLRVHGFAAVPTGDVIKIVPEANAKQDSIPMEGEQDAPGRDQAVTVVVPLENVNAAQLVPVLRPLVPPQGHLAAYATTNVLILSDRAANVERLQRIIQRVDLVSTEELEVLRLEYASASEVVRVLGSLTTRGSGPEGGGAGATRVVADDRTNSIIMSGERSERLRYRTIIAHLDTPLSSGGNTHVIYLRYAKAPDLVPILQGVSSSTPAAGGEGAAVAPANTPKVDIQADETTNSLIVTAPPDALQTLRQVIAQLDIRRAQVLVEAVIADITSDRAAQLGVSWVLDASRKSPGAAGVISLGDGLNSILGAIGGGSGGDGNIGVPESAPGGATVAIGDLNGSVQFAAIIRALASDGESNLLSTPTLVTLDNEEAEIVVGDNVPFVTGQFTNTGASDAVGQVNPFQTIQREDVGLTLKVKPQINEGNSIRLEITQEVSSLRSAAASASVGASDITTSKRLIKTAVLAEDGQIVVLGGLIDDTTRETLNKVPGLGDIPGLGRLFQYRETSLAKRNLMVFIRPVILREPQYTDMVTNRKYLYMRDRQLAQRESGVDLMPDADVPVLPSPEEIKEQESLRPVYKSKDEMTDSAQDSVPSSDYNRSWSDKESRPVW